MARGHRFPLQVLNNPLPIKMWCTTPDCLLRGKLGAVHLVTPNELLYEPGVEGVEVTTKRSLKP